MLQHIGMRRFFSAYLIKLNRNITISKGITHIAPMILDSKDEDIFIEDPEFDKYGFFD